MIRRRARSSFHVVVFKRCPHNPWARLLASRTWRKTFEMSLSDTPLILDISLWERSENWPVGSQCDSSVPSACFQWPSSGLSVCSNCVNYHWIAAGTQPVHWHQPVWFQWHSSVLIVPLVFRCVPIKQMSPGLPLEGPMVIAQSMWFQCCRSSGITVYQWPASVFQLCKLTLGFYNWKLTHQS